jgi:anthranilate synthase component 2
LQINEAFMKNILVIDNYDSFTYNLVHYLESLDAKVTVLLNDEVTLDDPKHFDKLLLSPGPGIPQEAGTLLDVIKTYASTKSILGVCLGQQAIAEVFGGSLINLNTVHHGVAATIDILVDDEPLFDNLPSQIEVGRYHSWSVDPATLPDVLETTSVDNNRQIMSLRHKNFDVKGVQFHPESVLTPQGRQILYNWLHI